MTFSVKRLWMPFLCFAFLLLIINSCKHKPDVVVTEASGYPPEIANILVSRCTNGCHNATSASASGGLRLDVWDRLFDGGSQGAAIVPYDTLNSPLLYFINTDASLGPVATPLMPYSPDPANPATPLTKDEYLTIRHWIAMGAPDKNGIVPFSSNPETRQKMYLTEQACDYLSVIDAERNVIMRNIKIGTTSQPEIAHCVRVDKQGRYAYVSFTSGNVIQKIDTRTDQVVDSVALNVPSAQWNILHISDDGSKLMVSGFAQPIAKLINTNTMTVMATNDNPRLLTPHGIASNASFDTFYVTGQTGNIVYKATATGYVKAISIDANAPSVLSSRDPHEIMMVPDRSKYFLTCQKSNEVRVMDAKADTVMYIFNVANYPQEMAISTSAAHPYIYVTCQEGPTSFQRAGALVVINYETMQVVKTLSGDFYQPHGVTVDEQKDLLYVASRNVGGSGPAPHHSSNCSGNNGWYDIYNIDTWQKVRGRFEAMPDCYSFDSRFKD